MARTPLHFRTVLALILLAGLAFVFASLGRWQLSRAAERDAARAELTEAAALPPLQLSPQTPSQALQAWRPARAQGRWLHDYTVLIENRNFQAQPGYWVVTPLALQEGAADSGNAKQPVSVAVMRGWLARDEVMVSQGGKPEPLAGLAQRLASTNATVQLEGELFDHVPRLLELWSWSTPTDSPLAELSHDKHTLPMVHNLDIQDYARASGLSLLPAVLAQTNPDPHLASLVQDWPHPSTDADTNRGYALQWFGFCAIATAAFLTVAWRAWRRVAQDVS